MKFKVRAQTLIEIEIEAVDQDEAEEKMFDIIINEDFRLKSMDWCISSYPLDETEKYFGRNVNEDEQNWEED